MIETFDTLSTGAATANKALGGAPGIFALVGIALAGVVTGLAGLKQLGWLSKIGTFLKGTVASLGEMVGALFDPATWGVIAIIIVALVELYGAFRMFSDVSDKLSKSKDFKDVLDRLGKAWDDFTTAIAGPMGEIEKLASDEWTDAVKSWSEIITAGLETVVEGLKNLAAILKFLDDLGVLPKSTPSASTGQDAQRDTARNTKDISDKLDDIRGALVGGRDRARRVFSDLQVEAALNRAIAHGVG
jgi:hypothetical protein